MKIYTYVFLIAVVLHRKMEAGGVPPMGTGMPPGPPQMVPMTKVELSMAAKWALFYWQYD